MCDEEQAVEAVCGQEEPVQSTDTCVEVPEGQPVETEAAGSQSEPETQPVEVAE